MRCIPGALQKHHNDKFSVQPSEQASVPDVVNQRFQISWIALRSLPSRLWHNPELEIAPEEAHLHQWDMCHMTCIGMWLKSST